MKNPVFTLKDNQLSAYAMHCGYIQRATDTGCQHNYGKHVDLKSDGHHAWVVTVWDDEKGGILREFFHSLKSARVFWKTQVKTYNTIKCHNGVI